MDKKPINSARDLEELLNDPLADPEPLTYTLLETITSGFEKRLGSGGHGDVYLGVLGKGKKVAVKWLVYTDADDVGIDELLRHEIDCFMRTKHHNVARLLGYCADIPRKMVLDAYGINTFTQSPKRYLCLEYAPNGDLQAYIEGSDGDDWRTYCQIIMGICQGLEHIHRQHIIHLDLKPKNILLDAYMRMRITDFGVSKCFTEEQSTEIVKCPIGTDGFKAPEMESRSEVSYKSDIYALGVTIARLLMRKNTYTVKKWLEENAAEKNCPKEKRIFVDIARGCMRHDPSERITLQEIMVQLAEIGQNNGKIDDSEDVIKVVPHEMRFRPFDLESAESSTLNIVNRTGQYVAYNISSNQDHGTGIIGPRSTRTIDISISENKHRIDMTRETSETFHVQTTVVTKIIDKTDVPAGLFQMVIPGRRIYKVDVVAVFEAVPTPSNAECTPGDTSSQVIKDSSGLLDVHPLVLHFPFEPYKSIPCLLHLKNNTDRHVAFILSDKDRKVFKSTLHDIIPPRSTHSLVVVASRHRTFPIASHYALILRSCLCDDEDSAGLMKTDECEQFFKRMAASAGVVHKWKLRAVYVRQGEMASEVSCFK